MAPLPSRTLDHIFATFPKWVMGTLLLVGVAINFSNVISRHFFGFALFWAEEILVFIVIWSVFLGAVAVTYEGAHLKMDLFSSRVRGPLRHLFNVAVILAFVAAAGFVIPQSFEVVSLMGRLGQVSVAASVPMIVPHTAILVGFILILLAVVVRVRAYLTGDFSGGGPV